ncbi:MAG TPA: alpha/beta fold hydrolase [Ktedonobacteraceae bacterium]|nr:alpha/beta fold hydrolase [Ktedonobacteraceae bacterium]
MATILSMPKWGLSMKTGLVVEWLKHVGDGVQEGDPIVEIESEKATNEVDSPTTGTLRYIVVNDGESAAVSEPIAVISAPGEELSDEQVDALLREDADQRRKKAEALLRPHAATPAGAAPSAGASVRAATGAGSRINASPAARRLAQELGVDLSTVTGTGPGGMIGREDVQRAAAAEQEATSEAEEKTLAVDGVNIHYLVAGPLRAPHVMFVHGLGGSLSTWSLNLPAFAGQFRICALDMVGAGASDKPATDYSIAAQAEFLARFLDALGPDWRSVSLVGHSLGGAVALAFAQRYPERVERLALVDSAGLGSDIDATVLDLMRSEPKPEHIRAELTLFFAHPGMVQEVLVEQIRQQRSQPGARAALLATSEAAFGGGRQHDDFREMLAGWTKPLLIVWGDADAVIPVAHARAANRGRVEVLAGCGHCPHIERADAFNQVMLSFLGEGAPLI